MLSAAADLKLVIAADPRWHTCVDDNHALGSCMLQREVNTVL